VPLVSLSSCQFARKSKPVKKPSTGFLPPGGIPDFSSGQLVQHSRWSARKERNGNYGFSDLRLELPLLKN